MKTIQLLILLLLLLFKQERISNLTILEYTKWKPNEKLREYAFEADTTIRQIFVEQTFRNLSKNSWELEYIFKNSDSLPISKSIERYHSNNTIQVKGHSIYELDTNGNYSELKAEIMTKECFPLSDKSHYELKYRFKNDSSLIMSIHAELSPSIEHCDTLNEKLFILKVKDTFYLDYNDNRNDTILYQFEKRIYQKGEGLIQFELTTNNHTELYKIKKKYFR